MYSAWVCSLGTEGSHVDPTVPRQVIHDSMQPVVMAWHGQCHRLCEVVIRF